MKRQIINELKIWANSSQRLPLLLRGARQVGKTFVIEQLAANHFHQSLTINFELEPEYNQCFESLKPLDIVNAVQALSRKKIIPGTTLLFLDEIQNCPRAIMALRYFKEQMPDLHIIGAGSLLEFALNDNDFTMPVGRVQFIYLKPLSFQEFLSARGFDDLLTTIKNCTLEQPLNQALHQKLLNLVHEYSIIGGMPAAIQTYLNHGDFLLSQRMQTVIMSTYRSDFGKYAKLAQHKYLQKIFTQTPGLVGNQIKYSNFDPNMRSRDLKQAIEDLTQAGIIQPVFASAANGLPLSASINEKKFKLLFLDIGLMNRSVSVGVNDLLNKDILLLNKGAIAEQLAGQELLAYQDCYESAQLYYWHRDTQGSSAEVDYIINIDSHIFPIEVKSSKNGRLKSLQLLLREKNLPLGVRISQQPLQYHQNLLSIPFYLIGQLSRLIKLALG